MKKLHGIRVVAYAQKRRKRNRQKVWKRAHTNLWSVFGFLTGRGVTDSPLYTGLSRRPQRYLTRG